MLRPLVRPLVRALTRSPMESRGLRPTLSLDFTNGGVTDSRVTYSGGANGTRVNSAGLIVAATTPRFDYNPTTLAPLGLLVEEARTNLRLGSGDLGGVHFVDASAAARTANQIVAPDGTMSGCLVTANGASSAHYIGDVVSEGAGVKCNSLFAKMGTQRYLQIAVGGSAVPYANFDLQAGTASAYGAGTTATITNFGNGWYRCSMATTEVLANGVRYGLVTGMAATRLESNTLATTFYLWGAQTEAVSTFPTSYIPTTSAAVTRSADSAVMTGTNFSSWYNAAEGTFVFSYSDAPTDTGRPVLIVRASDPNNRLQMDTTFSYALDGGVIQSSTGTGAVKAAAKLASAFKTNDFATCTNGGAVSAGVSGTNPTGMESMTIGKFDFGGGSSLNGHIQYIRFLPQRLPNATLQGMTA